MEAIAPVALALSVSLDAVTSLGLVLMSYTGPFVKAMLPMTDNVRLNIAAGLGDLLLLTLLRGCLVMLPLLGLSATLPWLAAAVTVVAALSGWLVTKAVLLYQLAAADQTPRTGSFFVQETGVTLHLPILLAAEGLGVLMAWALLVLVWINRRVMQQPAAGDPIIALHTRTAALEQRMAVQEWVRQQQPAGVGPELTAPLLGEAAAAEAAEAGLSGELVDKAGVGPRQQSNASWVTAPESLPSTSSVPAPMGSAELFVEPAHLHHVQAARTAGV